MIYDNFGSIRDLLKQNVARQFCRNRNKDVSILIETHINIDQIHHIRNNSLSNIFFSPGDSHAKRLLVVLYLGLDSVTELDTDPKGKQLLRGRFFERVQNHMENKNEGNENTIILGDFNCTMDKLERNGRNKTFYVISIMSCQNSLRIMDWRTYGEGRTLIPVGSAATIGLLAQDLR